MVKMLAPKPESDPWALEEEAVTFTYLQHTHARAHIHTHFLKEEKKKEMAQQFMNHCYS